MNYDIELPNPFWIGINIKESEDRVGSIGCTVDCRLTLPRGEFLYTASNVWFEYSVFDNFISKLKELKDGQDSKAEFYDLDREILLVFSYDGIRLTINRSSIECGLASMEFEKEFDSELLMQHIERLEKFAKWW
jgi:hypothetical protein